MRVILRVSNLTFFVFFAFSLFGCARENQVAPEFVGTWTFDGLFNDKAQVSIFPDGKALVFQTSEDGRSLELVKRTSDSLVYLDPDEALAEPSDDPQAKRVYEFRPITLAKERGNSTFLLTVVHDQKVNTAESFAIVWNRIDKEPSSLPIAFEQSSSAAPEEFIGTWRFYNSIGDDEQMSIFPNGQVMFFYENGHIDRVNLKKSTDGLLTVPQPEFKGHELALKLDSADSALINTAIHRYQINKPWRRISAEPATEVVAITVRE